MLEEPSLAAKTWTPPRLRLGAVLAVAVVAGFVAWLVLRQGSTDKPASQASSAPATVKLVAPERLRQLAATLGHPLYWVGARPGTRYEVTRAAGGNIFIRYLPPQAQAGDRRPAFLAIGTYPVPNAFGRTKTASRRPGAVTVKMTGGAISVYDSAKPTSVYFAYPGSKVQVEVFDPSARTARALVFSGRLVPIK